MTPARAERERRKAEELQTKLNEDKFVEFSVACGEGDRTACHSLGEWWAVIKGDYNKAAHLYNENCLTGDHAPSCLNMGLLSRTGRGTPKSSIEARKYFVKGCSLDNMHSCDFAGRECLTSEPKDSGLGMSFLKKACTLGNSAACAYVGELLLTGKHGVKRSASEAFSFLKLACDERHMVSCRNLSVMHARGDGVPKDMSESHRYRDLALEYYQLQTGRSPVKARQKPTAAE